MTTFPARRAYRPEHSDGAGRLTRQKHVLRSRLNVKLIKVVGNKGNFIANRRLHWSACVPLVRTGSVHDARLSSGEERAHRCCDLIRRCTAPHVSVGITITGGAHNSVAASSSQACGVMTPCSPRSSMTGTPTFGSFAFIG